MTRLAPRRQPDWDDNVRAALTLAYGDRAQMFFGPDARPLGDAVDTMLHHPLLAGAWLAYNNVLLWDSALTDRQRELVVLRVAWLTKSNYEWTQHVRLAERFGLTRDEVDRIATHGGAASEWTPLEAALIDAADELVSDFRVSDATWQRLAEHLDARQLVEVLFTAGTYSALAMVFKSLELPIDPAGVTTSVGLPDPTTT